MASTLDMTTPQTTFSHAGVQAADTLVLTMALTIGAAVIFAMVMGFVWLAWRRDGESHPWWIVVGGIVVPVITLTALFVGSTLTLKAIAGGGPSDLVVDVRGHQYWWDVRHSFGDRQVRDANEVVIPVGRPVTFRLTSEDVIHSFWMPSLSGKMDMIPGRVNELTVTATETGRFRGQCAEFCGLSHPLMAFEVVVVSPADYAAYLERLTKEARDPVTPQEVAGQQVFLNAGCVACHRINGVTEDGGYVGPDLTRVGARASLGAGMWRMNLGNLAGWIADVQDMKPGANMPSYNHLSGPDLRAVAAYLRSLR